MSETLITVIVTGLVAILTGLVANISTITKFIIDHLRWRKEVKLEYLRGERQRRENMYKDTLYKLSKGVAEGSYPMDTISDIMILMPKDINDLLEKLMDEKDRKTGKEKLALMDIANAMKRHLSEIDKQIEDLVKK